MVDVVIQALGGLLTAAGVALVVVGALAMSGRLPRNRFAGVRTPATLRSDAAFRLGNRVAAPVVAAAGVVGVVGGGGALLSPTGAAGMLLLAMGSLGVVALALAGGLLGNRAAANLPSGPESSGPEPVDPGPVGCGGCRCGSGGCAAR